MPQTELLEVFIEKARHAGAQTVSCADLAEAVHYLSGRLSGTLLVPDTPSAARHGLSRMLSDAGCSVDSTFLPTAAESAEAGLTGVNFAIADTGTLVLDSTPEAIRLATTLPPCQYALLDPEKIVADGLAAVEPLRRLHMRADRNYIAYITGPSRTADIERVLTIGVHGPKELHILLVPGFSSDVLEM